MALLQRPAFSFYYPIFNQILPPENGDGAERYPFLSRFDFNEVVKYLFAFEVMFFESAKLNP